MNLFGYKRKNNKRDNQKRFNLLIFIFIVLLLINILLAFLIFFYWNIDDSEIDTERFIESINVDFLQ